MTAQWIKSPPDTPLPDETDCWVTDGTRVWYAYAYRYSSGGWTNGDCWEDFQREVTYYMPIAKPSPPQASDN